MEPGESGGAGLRRAMGLAPATAMVVGIIVGASIFVQPSLITEEVPSVPGVLLVWCVAGALTLIGSLITAELASAFPRSGGVYVFLSEGYSPAVGFLWGWAMFWSMHSGIVAAIAMIFARYAGTFVPLGDGGLRAVAIGAILLLSAVNLVGVRYGSAVQTAFTAAKLLAVGLIVAAGFLVRVPAADAGGGSAATGAGLLGVSAGGFVEALVAGLFAYGGWHMVTYAADETVDPRRTIPRALMAGTLLVTVAYVAMNAAYLRVLPLETVAASSRVAADFADRLVGSGAAWMSALVVVSTFGAMNGVILAGPRVYLAMARDGLLFRWLGAVHPGFRTPHRAILLQALWASALVATGTYRELFTRVIYTEWIFFGLMAASVLWLRRRPGYRPAYRVRAYPVLAALFVASTAGIVGHQLVTRPAESATGLLLVAAGLPVYHLWARRPCA
jgi:APA family basic amino acid/polyamine antiporter